ncbi:MAG: hypothetical protein UY07_C0019G0015 [Parcubacteria group bacterium GW2011_GWA1_47_8]|nr:MAG: hypothetical protein UY07_C0019G0015 [Parcubacteria group bacterium GW2011_GWA1_47_8]KKW07571.1 MAG: hypothetical protein UY42_C0010G0016 [Parcubacteria group bacterium GW2011_GWA2_49_16]
MPNQELVKYIQDSLAQNLAKEQINSSLLQAGWGSADVAEAFSVAEGRVAPAPHMAVAFVKWCGILYYRFYGNTLYPSRSKCTEDVASHDHVFHRGHWNRVGV